SPRQSRDRQCLWHTFDEYHPVVLVLRSGTTRKPEMRFLTILCVCLSLIVTVVLGRSDQSTNDTALRTLSRQERKVLLFPIQTTLQVSMLTATDGRLYAPKKKYPARKLGINLGFQQNFNLPFRLLEFYKPPTWARAIAGILRGQFPSTSVVTARGWKRSTDHQSLALSAGQLYTFVEDFLHVFGYDRDCLVKSVCELAHSPFDRTEKEEQDFMTEVVHLLLSPSEHESFGEDEADQKRAYEMAERLGASGANCDLIYDRCHRSVLKMYRFRPDKNSGLPSSRVAFFTCLLVVLVSGTIVHASECTQPTNSTTNPFEVHHNRDRRYVLSFPINGGVAKVLFGFVAPVRFHHMLKRSLNLGINLQANYRILPNIIFPHPDSVWKNRYSEEAYIDTGRKQLYALLEKFLVKAGDRNGHGERARACLLRTICEVADSPLTHNGMVGEILDVVFTPGDTDDLSDEYKMARKYGANGVDCARLYSECPFGHGILDTFRVNIKDGVADNSSIWAHGIGFRMNIEFYNPPGLKITRRDVHQSLESMIMAHGFDGRACILRTFCEVSKVMTPKSGILFKLFRLIFRSNASGSDDSSIGSSNSLPEGDDEYFPYLTANDCKELDRHCPITQLDMDGMNPAASEAVTEEARMKYY
uniref:Uncharacterized protein n=1 Tax=Anopheles minimus TaxID=112268 RepID=A0A182VYI2_9DIPT